MTEQIGSGTAQGVIDYLDSLVDKGRSRPGVVNPLKTAITKVLEATEGEDNWRTTDVTALDIEDIMVRFKNKTLSKYTAASYGAYQSRITRAIGWYKNFLASPGWVPKENARMQKVDNDSNGKKGVQAGDVRVATNSEPRREVGQLSSVVHESPKLDITAYPFPLANGETARVYMPKGVTSADVRRLTAFLEALVIEPVSKEG